MEKNILAVIATLSSSKQEQSQLTSAAAFVRDFLDNEVSRGYQSEVHGWEHMSFVALKTVQYIKNEGGSTDDQKIGFLAGLFHDIIRPKPKLMKETDKPPEVQSADLAEKKLRELGFSEVDVRQVCGAVLGHTFGVELKGSREIKRDENLVTNCLMSADKIRQVSLSVIRERPIFINESMDNPTKEQVIDYWTRRIKKAEEFLDTNAGKIMLKNEPNLLSDFEKVKAHFRSIEAAQ